MKKLSDEVSDIMQKLEYLKQNVYDLEFDGIDHNDYPDFCDAYITTAKIDDRELDQDEVDIINNDRDFVYEKLILHLY
jgi:hypothetical protein